MGVTSVWILITPGAMLLDLAGVAEPLRLANRYALAAGAKHPPFELKIVAAGGKALRASLPLRLTDVAELPRALGGSREHPAWVIVVGVASGLPASADEDAQTRAGVDWLTERVRPEVESGNARVWTVCSGALLAADAGLFDGRQCTTHHELIADLAARGKGVQVQENRIFVVDGPIASSAGITAGIDLALAAIHEHLGTEVATQVARDLVVYWRRGGADPQISPLLDHRNHLHAAVHRVQDAVLAEPAATWTEDRLANVACVSARHLRRLFREHAGVNPLGYVQRIRTALAQQLLRQGRLGLEQVASRVGFSSARQLRQAWKQHAAGRPSDIKRGDAPRGTGWARPGD